MKARNSSQRRSTHQKKQRRSFFGSLLGAFWSPASKHAAELKSELAVESLEDRRLLTTTLFLDFGAGIGVGNTLSTTVNDFRDIFGVGAAGGGGSFGTGSDMTSGGLLGGDSLDFRPLAYDFNGDSSVDNADLAALGAAVLPIVQRAMEPFDITVVIAAATSIADAVTSVAANAGDATGEFDAYNFIMDIISDGFGGGSVGDNSNADGDRNDNSGLFGIAAADDLFAQAGNQQDEATLTFADTVFGATPGVVGTAQFNRNLAYRIAYTATHEAFHTFTLVHTNGLTSSGDVIRVGSNTRDFPFFVTRFDLTHDAVVAQPNNYLFTANDADIGLRDDDASGRPDLAYVTGTGAHDRIALTNAGGGFVDVRVDAYSDAAKTSLIRTETYTIDLATDTDGTILIDGGINNDDIEIDGTIAATFLIRGGAGTDPSLTERDRLIVRGGGGTGSYTPVGTDGGTVSVTGGASITATELEPVEISGFATFTFIAPNAADNVSLLNATAVGGQAAVQLTGTSGGVAFEVPTFFDVTALNIDLASNDGAATSDTASVNVTVAPQGISTVTIDTGGGDDTFEIRGTTAGLTTNVNAGSGNDSLRLSSNGTGVTGNVSAINGPVNLDGQGGSNTLLVSDDSADGNAAVVVSHNTISGLAPAEISYVATGGCYGGGVNVRTSAAGADTVFVTRILANVTTTINTLGGTDRVNVDSNSAAAGGRVDGIVGALSVIGGGQAGDTLGVMDFDETAARNVTATGSKVGAGGGDNFLPAGGSISYSGMRQLILQSGNTAADTVNVVANATTSFDLNGGNPATSPGDALVYDGPDPATKTISGANSGQITGAGVQSVTFANFETVSASGLKKFDDVVVVPTDGTANQVLIRRNVGGTMLEILVDTNTTDNGGVPNPVIFSTQPYSAVRTITVTGSADPDRTVIDNSNGLINRTVNVMGNGPVASPGDSLLITGDPGSVAVRETYLVGATQDAGTWIVDPDGNRGAGANLAANGDELIVNFTGLEPVDSDMPATTFDLILSGANDVVSIEDGVLGAPFTTPNLQVIDVGGTFETTTFANKTNVRVMGVSGSDSLTLNYTVAAAGMATLELYGHVASGVGGQPADDNVGDTLRFSQSAAGIAHQLRGNGGNDLFTSGNANLDPVQGTYGINGDSGTDMLYLDDTNSLTANTVSVTSTDIAGAAPTTFLYSSIDVVAIFTSRTTNDVVDVTSTNSGTRYLIGGSQTGADVITIGNTAADFAGGVFDGSLDTIAGPVTVVPDPTGTTDTDTLNVDDSGTASLNAAATISNQGATTFTAGPAGATGDSRSISISGSTTRLAGFAPANIEYFHTLGATSRLETLNVRASQGNDSIAINDTTATTSTTVDAREGNDALTIRGDFLSAQNNLLGFDGNDTFTMTITSHIGQSAFATVSGVTIQGNNNPVADTNNRDRLTINDNNSAFARDITYDYLDTQGDVNILANAAGSGLFGSNSGGALALNLRTLETLVFNSTGTNDLVNVLGTSRDDLLTVALRPSATSAFVFLDGNPYLDVPPESLATFLPGLAGGGQGTDMLINGALGTRGIRLDGSGTDSVGNRAVVQALSESDLLVPGGTNDIFGLGTPGVLVPGVGAGNAYDLIGINGATVSDPAGSSSSAANQVTTRNTVSGPLLPVSLVAATFTNGGLPTARAGLTINAGDEAAPRANGIADHIAATAHPSFNIAVNGNLPGLAFGGNGLPIGDQLDLTSPSSFNIWSDKTTPPSVSIFAGNDPFGVVNSSIERTLLSPGNGVLNLIGDNNTVNFDQDDNFVVTGRDVDGNPSDAGYQEFTVVINGSAPILVDGVQFLNAYGYDLIGVDRTNPGINAKADQEAGGIDTLDLRPYADNTPRGWGVHVNFNEGAPAGVDGDQADLLIYRTSLFGGPVSEAIVVQPSAPDAGQLFANNSSTGTPIVVVDYLANTDIRVLDDDGFASDTDQLTLRGTNPDPANAQVSGNESFVADFTAAGNAANPMVTVRDANSNSILYRLQTLQNFNTVNIEMLAGRDTATLIGRNDGSLRIVVDGGADAQADTVTLVGVQDDSDRFTTTPGAGSGALDASVSRAGATGATIVSLSRVDQLVADGGGGVGTDVLSVNGSSATNTATIRPLDALNGSVAVDDFAVVSYANLGSRASVLSYSSDAGSGGNLDRVRVIGTANADLYSWTPTAVNDADLNLTDAAGNNVNVRICGVSDAALDAGTPGVGANPADTLSAAAFNATIVAGATVGSGTVNSVNAANQPLLSLAYSNVENPVVVGGTLVITATAGSDTISLGLEDLAGDGTADQEVVRVNGNPVDVTAANAVVLNGLAGDDSFSIAPVLGANSISIPGGLSVIGGDGNDSVSVTLQAGVAAGLNFATGTFTGILTAGGISMQGVESATANGSDAQTDSFTVSNYGVASDIRSLTLNGGDLDNAGDSDTINISLTSGPDVLSYTSLSPSTASFSRGGAGPTISLVGFNNSDDNLRVDGGPNVDQLDFIGSASNDRITLVQTGIAGLSRATLAANLVNVWVPISFSSFNHVNVLGGAGNDELVTDNVSGLLGFSSGIHYDGQSGNDLLRLVGPNAVDATYSVGPDVTAGTVVHSAAGVTQRVTFQNLEPVIDLVPGSLTVQGTADANQISYSAVSATNGLIAIDSYETLEFANKIDLTINGNGGTDSIHLAGTSSGFTGTLRVNGGDPTDGDSLSLNAVAATVAVDVATSTITGAGPASIVYFGLSSIQANLSGGANLSISGASAYQSIPRATADAGLVTADNFPISYLGISAVSSISLAGGGAVDQLTLLTSEGDDSVRVVSGDSIAVTGRPTVFTTQIENLTLQLLDGSDDVEIRQQGNRYDLIQVESGNGEDLVTAVGNGVDPLTVQLQPASSDLIGGGLTNRRISLTDTEAAAISNAASDIRFLGQTANEQYRVTPQSADSAVVTISGSGTRFTTTNTGSLSVVDGAAGDSDTLTVELGAAAETVTINATVVEVTAGPALKRVDYDSTNIEGLRVLGNGGADTFNVTPVANVPIFIDGGDPVATTPFAAGDALVITGNLGFAGFGAGPESDEGSVTTDLGEVSYDHLESLSISDIAGDDMQFSVSGTNGDDDITLIGQQQFGYTVSVNGGPAILVTGSNNAALSGLSGDDDFDVDLNVANLDVTITVDGQSPVADGDRLTITGVAGTNDAANYTPGAANSATLNLVTSAGPISVFSIESVTYSGENDNETLTVSGTGRFTHRPGSSIDSGSVQVDSTIPLAYVALGGGGRVAIDATGLTDSLVAFGGASSDRIDIAANTGNIALISDLGAHVVIDRAAFANLENVIVDGLEGDDQFTVTGPQPYRSVSLLGNDPSASDSASLIGDGSDMSYATGGQSQTATGGGLGVVTLSGIEHVSLDAGAGNIRISGNADPNAFDVTPVSATSALFAVAGVNQQLRTTNAGTLLLDEGTAADGDQVTVRGTSAADTIGITRGGTSTVAVNGLKLISITTGAMEALIVDAGLGADTINVSGSAGPGLTVIGGDDATIAQTDRLNVTNTSTAGTTTTIRPSDKENAGTVENLDGIVNYEGIANLGVTANSAAETIAVLGTHAGDEIALAFLGGANRVWLNGRAVLQFASFGTVSLQGRFGDDRFSVSPTGLVGVNSILVDGGDPTASDELIVNGTSAANAITFAPTGAESGSVTLGIPITYTTTEHVTINGQGGGDSLAIQNTVANAAFTYTPGATPDAASVAGRILGGSPLTPLAFTNLGAAGTVSFTSSLAQPADVLDLLGTDLDDVVRVAANGNLQILDPQGLARTLVISTPAITTANLHGLSGVDQFEVTGTTKYSTLTVHGGAGDSGDRLVLTTPVTTPAGVNLGSSTISGYGAANFRYEGLTLISIDAGAAVVELTGTAADDTLAVTPLDANSGHVQANGAAPTVHYRNTAGNAVRIDGATGQDRIEVRGNSLAQTFDVNMATATVAVDDLGDATNDGVVTWTSIEAVTVSGQEGNDLFVVVPGAIDLFIDGGNPIATSNAITSGDTLSITANLASVTFQPGPESDEGGFTTNLGNVSYDKIEGSSVVDTAGNDMQVTIVGTNGDDDITFTGIGANEYSVSVNGGPAVRFSGSNFAQLEGRAGDDDFDIDIEVANLDVSIVVDGQSPLAEGDRVTVTGVAGLNDLPVYTPTSSNSASLGLGTLVTPIILGGVESVTYVGEGDNETLSISGSGTFTHSPGSTIDSGNLQLNTLLPIHYSQLGAAGQVAIDGTGPDDALVAFGRDSNDRFTILAGSGNVVLVSDLGTHATLDRVSFANVESLVLEALNGDDRFVLFGAQPYQAVTLSGNDPSASDLAELFGDGTDMILQTGQATQTVQGGGFQNVTLVGIEELRMNAAAGRINILGNGDPNAFSVTPIGVDTAWITVSGVNQLVRAESIGNLTIAEGTALDGDSVLVHGTSQSDHILITRGADAVVSVNGLKPVHVTTAAVEALLVDAGRGVDTVSVTGAAGPGLTVIGGDDATVAQADRLNVTNTATAGASTTIRPSDLNSAGIVDNADGLVNFVGFTNVAVTASTAAETIVFQGTHAGDEIALAFLGGANRVWMNGRAVVQFATFGTVSLQGRFGDDRFSVSPAGLVGVTSVLVDGGDPTASDELIVNGTATADAITYAPTSAESGTVTLAIPITFTKTEHVTINGQAGGDALIVRSPAGADGFSYLPGATADSAEVLGRSIAGSRILTPLSFKDLGLNGTLQFGSATAGEDILDLYGTALDDTFTLAANGAAQIVDWLQLARTLPINTPGIGFIELHGLDGSDTFQVAGTALFTSIGVRGGGPDDGDVLNLWAPLAAASVDLGNALVGGYGPQIFFYSGLHAINIDAGGQTLTVLGTAGDDTIVATVFDASAGTVEANGDAPVVNYANTNRNPLNVDPVAGQDRLHVRGNALSQTFDINIPARSVSVDDLNNAVLDGTVTFTTNTEALGVFGLEGDDTFNITAGNIPLFFDGGDPIGQTAGDRFVVNAGGALVTFEAGPEDDEGGIIVNGNARLSFDHIEAGVVAGAKCVLIMGTNGDDDITIIARTQLANPLRFATADGNKDFTSSVNGGPEILWVNNNAADPDIELFIDALSGDDDVVFQAPAINPANNQPIAWNVRAFLVGGTPSAATGDQGDLFEFETPAANWVQYEPLTSETGTIRLDSANSGQTFDTIINLVRNFVVDCDKNGINEYASSDGGFESLIYDGETGNDRLTILDLASSDLIVHTPGAGRDEGTIRVNETLAMTYQNLGLTATITVNAVTGGADTLVANGTELSDRFHVDRSATLGRIALNAQLPLLTSGIEIYTLNGLDGDDAFQIQLPVAAGVNTINTNGGGPGGSDSLTINGEAGVVNAVNVNPGLTSGFGNVTASGNGNLLTAYTGIEHLFLAGNAQDADTLQISDDQRDSHWTVSAGTAGDLVQIAGRESFDYGGFRDVTLINQEGSDLFQVYPTNLTGFSNLLTVVGFPNTPISDVVEIIGTPGIDTVTSTATTITTNAVPVAIGANFTEIRVITLADDDSVTLGLSLAGSRKLVDAGEGNDVVNVSTMQDATIYGGDGDDTLTGSPLADLIFGGAGNDTISGLAGIDTIYGDDGNDVITAGTGDDKIFGGSGSDRNIWNNGDNSDVFEGDEGVDVQIINGSVTAGDNFVLRTKTGDAARAFFERTNLIPFTIDMGKVEQIDISSGIGADNIDVRDLATTDVRQINLDVGLDLAGPETDTVTVAGRTVSDVVTITAQAAVVNIAGLAYDVNVANIDSPGDNDRLTFNANEGNDVVTASDGLSAIFGVTLANVNNLTINGGEGDDYLSGFGALNGDAGNDTLAGNETPADGVLISQTLNGGAGNDLILGGDGDDLLIGGAGEDRFIGGSGADTIDGGADWDAILISGTSGPDVIDVNQTLATSLSHTVNAALQVDTLVLAAGARTVEEARISSESGADLIRVQNADALAIDAALNAVQMNVLAGSATGAGDRLIIVDNGADDLTIYRKDVSDSNGTVTVGPGNAEAFEVVFDGVERVQFLDEAGITLNSPATGSRLAVFKHDPYEYNDDRFVATHIGANQTVNVDPTIDPGPITNPFGDGQNVPGDDDWYLIEAEVTGTLDVQAFFEEVATIPSSGRPGLPNNGNLDIELYDVDGTLIAGAGPNFGGNNGGGANPELNVDGDPFAENERIRIPAVQGQVYYLRVFGNVANGVVAANNYNLTVINVAPPTPYAMELDDNPANGATNPPGQADNSDTGRSQHDNITYDNTPTLFFRLDDGIFLHDAPGNAVNGVPVDEVIRIPFQAGIAQPTAPGFAIAIFDEGNTLPQTAVAPQVPLGFAVATGQEGVYSFTTPTLSDGSHFLTARVQMIDPANPQQIGFGPRSVPFEIVVDTVPPPVFFGDAASATDGLHPDSDSGVIPQAPTFVDRITNDTTPTFFGVAEANSIVRAYIDRNNDGLVDTGDVFIGLAVSEPLDGTNQYPNGRWELTSDVHMNAPNAVTLGGATVDLGVDGTRRILLTAEDVPGNLSAPQSLRIMVDTQGPQVTDVFITADPAFNLFDLKPTPRPTPLVNTLSIRLRDLPNRDPANFPIHPALSAIVAATPGQYLLTGDYNGRIPIQSITVLLDPLVNGAPATGTVQLTFFEPLPDDRFTLTISDEVVDIAGNKLDGESNAQEPVGTPTFPSGDGQPGTNFVARFTVDSRPELGAWDSGNVWVDTNGNNQFDPGNLDFVNRDIVYAVRHLTSNDKFFTSDDVIAGNFSATAASVADGFDKLGAYGKDATGVYRWLIDTNNDGVADIKAIDPAAVNGLPFAGDFDGNPANGDEVGVFDGTNWFLDTDHDYRVNVASQFTNGLRGWPIAGDFDGDGLDDVGAWSDDAFMFDLRYNGFGQVDATIEFGYIGVRERPVAADMDQDGIDDVGLWVPDRAGQNPQEAAEWYFLVSNDPTGAVRHSGAGFVGQTRVNTLDHAFKPVPFGKDTYAAYGDEFALPIVGNFDPPINGSSGNPDSHTSGPNVNPRNAYDVNNDGLVTNLDALLLINDLNHNRSRRLETVAVAAPFLDINGDNIIAPVDAILLINYLNGLTASLVRGGGGGEGESALLAASPLASSAARKIVPPVALQASATTAAAGSMRSVEIPPILADNGSSGVGSARFINPIEESFDALLDQLAADLEGAHREQVADKLFKRM